MKKTFTMTHPKIKVARLFEAVKRDLKKYVKRERGKALPEGVDFWDFDCKFGATAQAAKKMHLAEFNTHIDRAEKQQLESFYVEILAKPGRRTKKPKSDGKPEHPSKDNQKGTAANGTAGS